MENLFLRFGIILVDIFHCIYNALNNAIYTVEQIQDLCVDLGEVDNELSDLFRSIGVHLLKLVSSSKKINE